MFEVRFLDYANPGQRTGQMACCSGQEVDGSCPSPCSTFFRVCVRPLAGTAGCIFGEKNSDVLGNSSFAIPSNSLLQIPGPDSLSWPVRLNLAFAMASGTERDFHSIWHCWSTCKNIIWSRCFWTRRTLPERNLEQWHYFEILINVVSSFPSSFPAWNHLMQHNIVRPISVPLTDRAFRSCVGIFSFEVRAILKYHLSCVSC